MTEKEKAEGHIKERGEVCREQSKDRQVEAMKTRPARSGLVSQTNSH